MFLTREVPRKTAFENGAPKLFLKIQTKIVPDTLPEDQSLILDTEKGPVLIFGCSHPEMINIMHHVVQRMKIDPVHAILGETLLDFLTPEQLEEFIRRPKEMTMDRIDVSLCTGLRVALSPAAGIQGPVLLWMGRQWAGGPRGIGLRLFFAERIGGIPQMKIIFLVREDTPE